MKNKKIILFFAIFLILIIAVLTLFFLNKNKNSESINENEILQTSEEEKQDTIKEEINKYYQFDEAELMKSDEKGDLYKLHKGDVETYVLYKDGSVSRIDIAASSSSSVSN